jgi:AraC family transcriptional regulator
MEAQIETFEPITVAFVRHVGPYDQCAPAWQKLCSTPAVLSRMGPDTLSIGISYDDPDVTEPDKIRFDACDGVDKQCIAGGDYAVMIHKGDYGGLHACYRWLYGEWLPNSGREPKSAPSLEIYRTDPSTTPPEENITEIRVPLT